MRWFPLLIISASTVWAQQFTNGPWTYTLNASNEATITSYSGPGGAVVFPSSLDGNPVKKVGDGWPPIFAHPNTTVTSVTVPDSVTSIGYGAFYQCRALTNMSIGNGVTNIGEFAFRGCSALTNVTIPDSVTNIGGYAFDYCTSLTSVTIGNSVTSIGQNAFYYCPALTNVTIPDSVTSIGGYAFYSCNTLTTIVIPDSVTSVGERAFMSCRAITNVMIGNGVTSIGDSAFYYCTALTKVTIGNSVTSIGGEAFSHSALTTLTIPESVTNIGDSFRNCGSLRELYFLGNAPSADEGLFGGISPLGIVYYVTCASGWGPTFQTWPTRELSAGQMVNAVAANLSVEQIMSAASAHQFLRGQASVTTNPSAFNLFTQNERESFGALQFSNGVNSVMTNPHEFSLFTQSQFDGNRVVGQLDVINSPMSYGLYTSDSIMDLRMNGLMVQKQGNNAVVSFQPQTTTDLTQPFTNNGTPITNTVPMPGNKGFLRIQAR